MIEPERQEFLRLYILACQYLSLDEWYEIFIRYDFSERPGAMIQAARVKYQHEHIQEYIL